MSKKDDDQSPAAAADAFESEIRAGSRSMLTPEERQEAGLAKTILTLKWAAAKERAAAEAHLAAAEEHENQIAELEKKKGA